MLRLYERSRMFRSGLRMFRSGSWMKSIFSLCPIAGGVTQR